jgi:predicted nucleic acid-binding protein
MIVADAGPLIALARIQRLSLLQQLYGEVLIPAAVQRELQLDTHRPGAQVLTQAIDAGWLHAQTVGDTTELTTLSQPLDAGEAEAVLLAEQATCQFLLIDDWQGRTVAKQRGLPVVGVAGVLLAAKQQSLVTEIRPVLTELVMIGYRLSPRLVAKVICLAGEQPKQ